MKSTTQARYDLRYHFVWIPRYRKRVLAGGMARSIAGMVRYCCQVHEWEVYELTVAEDHVHLYMGAQPMYSPSQIMKLIKGGTSKKIREQYPEIDEVYWGATFWSDGYFVRSSGEVTDEVVSHYIRNHRQLLNQETEGFNPRYFIQELPVPDPYAPNYRTMNEVKK